MINYNLDAANYLSAPNLANDAMLLLTGAELELITDVEILHMVSNMKRGGLCFVGSKRYVKANNKYLDDYDETKESNYLMYWDANALYGGTMCEYLPYGGFKFIEVNDKNIQLTLSTSPTNDEGYYTKCDFLILKNYMVNLRNIHHRQKH